MSYIDTQYTQQLARKPKSPTLRRSKLRDTGFPSEAHNCTVGMALWRVVRMTLRPIKVDARKSKEEEKTVSLEVCRSVQRVGDSRIRLEEDLACNLAYCQPPSHYSRLCRLTAHPPAKLAQIPELIAICLVPRVLLKRAPLSAPATTLLVISCLPR